MFGFFCIAQCFCISSMLYVWVIHSFVLLGHIPVQWIYHYNSVIFMSMDICAVGSSELWSTFLYSFLIFILWAYVFILLGKCFSRIVVPKSRYMFHIFRRVFQCCTIFYSKFWLFCILTSLWCSEALSVRAILGVRIVYHFSFNLHFPLT